MHKYLAIFFHPNLGARNITKKFEKTSPNTHAVVFKKEESFGFVTMSLYSLLFLLFLQVFGKLL